LLYYKASHIKALWALSKDLSIHVNVHSASDTKLGFCYMGLPIHRKRHVAHYLIKRSPNKISLNSWYRAFSQARNCTRYSNPPTFHKPNHDSAHCGSKRPICQV